MCMSDFQVDLYRNRYAWIEVCLRKISRTWPKSLSTRGWDVHQDTWQGKTPSSLTHNTPCLVVGYVRCHTAQTINSLPVTVIQCAHPRIKATLVNLSRGCGPARHAPQTRKNIVIFAKVCGPIGERRSLKSLEHKKDIFQGNYPRNFNLQSFGWRNSTQHEESKICNRLISWLKVGEFCKYRCWWRLKRSP